MGDFPSSIFGGSSPGLHQAANNLGSIAGYSSNVGQQGTNAALGYDKGILSGDPAQVAMTLAPETKTLQDQAQQNKNTVSQFGNRGGGMNAVMAGLDDATRAKFIQLLDGLRQGAAQNLGQIGLASTGQGIQSNMGAGQLSQQELENMMNSILGKGIGATVGAGTSALNTGLFG